MYNTCESNTIQHSISWFKHHAVNEVRGLFLFRVCRVRGTVPVVHVWGCSEVKVMRHDPVDIMYRFTEAEATWESERRRQRKTEKYERETQWGVSQILETERKRETDWTKPLTAPSTHRLIQQGGRLCEGGPAHQGQTAPNCPFSAEKNADVMLFVCVQWYLDDSSRSVF